MSRKFSLIPIALIVLVGAIWASSIITPDKPGFPSLPNTPGTLGYALEQFGSDGTAIDTLALSGRSATGYLQKSGADCMLAGEVWRGFQSDGTVLCETVGPLLAIGRFSELNPGMTVSSDGGATWTPANTTDILYAGYLVRSDATGTGTIDFLADDSIIRMDTNTLVQLEMGDLDGNTVAQAIVNDGRLWGRVLTSTGINLGGGGLIAGVRGTSVSVEKDPSGNYRIYIIDSRHPTDAAKLKSTLGGGGGPFPIKTVGTLHESSYYSGSSSSIYTILMSAMSGPLVTRATYLTTPWIRQNTKRDLVYMDTIAATNPLALEEVAVTEPANIEESQAICDSTVKLWNTFSNECSKILTTADYSSNINYFSTISTLGGGIPVSGGNYDIYTGTGYGFTGTGTSSGHYLDYTLGSIIKSWLVGKTMTFVLENPIGYELPSLGDGTKFYLADMGSGHRYYAYKNKVDCNTGGVAPGKMPLCNGNTMIIPDITGKKIVQFTISSVPTSLTMTIGNHSGKLFPLGTTIKKVIIQ